VQYKRAHAYADPKNEILGDLGGHFDKSRNIVHATYFSPSRRIIDELAPESVEGETTEQHQAFVRFSERGLSYVGWYHSHPYLNPVPSDKDIRMQTEMQTQVPYAVGIICSPYMATRTSLPNCEVSYFNAFRVALVGDTSEVVNVTYSVNHNEIIPPNLIHEMLNINNVLLDEARKTYEYMREKCQRNRRTTHFIDNEYDSFLTRFLKDNVLSSMSGLQQDLRSVSQYKRQLLQRIFSKLQILKEMKYFSCKDEDASLSSLFAMFLQKSHESEADPIYINCINLLFTFNSWQDETVVTGASTRSPSPTSESRQQSNLQLQQQLSQTRRDLHEEQISKHRPLLESSQNRAEVHEEIIVADTDSDED
jgi:proteasome lid subunit RPN8/RPN11